MWSAYRIIILLYTIIDAVHSSKILVVFPVPGGSHFILGNALARGLAEAGHDVAMVSAFEDKTPTKNGTYRNIVLTGVKTEFESLMKNMNLFEMSDGIPLFSILKMNGMGEMMARWTLEHANVRKLIESDEKFDLVIIEQFLDDALNALACHFQAKLVLFSPIGANSWVNSAVGNPSPPSYISDTLLSYTNKMNFWQRSMNSLMVFAWELNDRFLSRPKQYQLAKKYLPKCVNDNAIISDVSLVFLNAHESITSPVPLVPNMINIGGFHVKPPKKLPSDLQDYIDNAKDGVVYFSFGSNLKPSQMNPETRMALVKALGKIKQKVLWKWDEDTIPGKPNNVKLGKWFPQQDILAHPNVKLFITHGGLLSTTETIYHGVPILALPVLGDQKMNAARAVAGGYALSLALSKITEENFSEALNEILNNPKYRENVKRRSALMHDRPVKPLDLAIYWTEFVIRHKGTPHLMVAALELTWYQYFLLDVIFVFFFVAIAMILATFLIVKKLCCTRKDKLKRN